MPLLGSEKIALKLMADAEELAKAPYLATIKRENRGLSAGEVAKMTQAIREAGLKALFAHMVLQTAVTGTGGGPAPVVGKIL